MLRRHDLSDEQGVVARVVLGPGRAFEPRERAVEERPVRPVAGRDVAPQHDRRNAAPRKMLREVRLGLGEDAHGERARVSERLVARRVLSDRDPDERWFE